MCKHIIPGWIHKQTTYKNEYYSLEEYTCENGTGRLVYINQLIDPITLDIPFELRDKPFIKQIEYISNHKDIQLVLDDISIQLPKEIIELISIKSIS
tara:strand:+ start:527 stop:817 length:291 start_codon:yes stop_codon:yes gene_type:complete